MMDEGNLYIIAAPSGTGKTTLVKALVDSLKNITVSISHTTRPKRPAEHDGINYYFIEKAEFNRLINQQEFLEYAVIFDNLYGTSKNWVKQTLAKGIDVILEIDWQGFQQTKQIFPQAIGIFILPPSFKDLQNRLVTRNQDHPEIIEKRLADARETVSHIHEFEYVVVNDEFQHALDDLRTIVLSGRLLGKRQVQKFAKLLEGFD